MRYTGPKKKLCRREGVNLFGTEKYNIQDSKKTFFKGGRKLSEFGFQLRKKQLAKRMFGLSEKQFSSYFKKAQKSNGEGTTGEKMLRLIELRLDNVIFRANFARTRMQARQFVNHAHFTVNGVKVSIPSISLKEGDIICLRDKLKESPLYKSLLEELEEFSKQNKGKVSGCKWIEIDSKNLKITVKSLPVKEDFEQIVDIQKIVEFYSK
ncbi:30S ribosomal protein S4 [Candidatus Gracilibacteria bacterium]|nr:MAG: 30S ribosomal protein S4 [Candidatus Gracilibacteria bacterium]PIE85053.1 MAG: 30S ribosomal protein S4 [Candidatus Gracilibacteria bacterium]